MVIYMIGQIIKLEAVLMVLPLIVSACYREFYCSIAFAAIIIFSLISGFTLTILFKPKNKIIYAREGFAIVALAWIILYQRRNTEFCQCVFGNRKRIYNNGFNNIKRY